MIRYRLICGATAGAGAAAVRPPTGKGRPKGRAETVAGKSAVGRPARPRATGCGQEFESWFQSSDAFETLVGLGQVVCPSCGSPHVDKALMAPSVKTTKAKAEAEANLPAPADAAAMPGPTAVRPLATLTPQQRAFVETMRKVREHVLSTSENVGRKFVEEARKIHYEEAETRSIYGEASIEEAKALAEEGIDVFPMPELPDDRN